MCIGGEGGGENYLKSPDTFARADFSNDFLVRAMSNQFQKHLVHSSEEHPGRTLKLLLLCDYLAFLLLSSRSAAKLLTDVHN